MSAQTSRQYGFTEVIKFIVYIKKLLCKNCLYAIYSQLSFVVALVLTEKVLSYICQRAFS